MKSKVPAILAGSYFALVLVSVVPVFIGDDAMSAVFAVILGAPWAQLVALVLDAIDPALLDGIATGLALAVVGGAINAAAVFFVSRWIVRRAQTGEQPVGN
jgi:hypothetical protein